MKEGVGVDLARWLGNFENGVGGVFRRNVRGELSANRVWSGTQSSVEELKMCGVVCVE